MATNIIISLTFGIVVAIVATILFYTKLFKDEE
jgi:hypothetical protein